MSQIVEAGEVGEKKTVMDPYEIGWYIESADEDIYGPVSRKTIRRFLEDNTISANTLVRHCTQPEARPVADQPVILTQLDFELQGGAVGDRLAEAWPRKRRDIQALAEDTLPCAWHRRRAVLVCVRCQAPYCPRCRTKPFRKQFFLCRRCQNGLISRRYGALVVDSLLLITLPMMAAGFALGFQEMDETQANLLMNGAGVVGGLLLFVRDSLFRGAGPGKRLSGLRVVRTQDGATPLTHGQGVVRWLSQWIPIFNLIDGLAAMGDPLMRRYGDRWAGTRVIDSERKLAKDRQRIARRLIKKGVQPVPELGMTMQDLARIA